MKATKKLHENQARVEQLTKDWTEKWKEAKSIMQVGGVGGALNINEKPHLQVTDSFVDIFCRRASYSFVVKVLVWFLSTLNFLIWFAWRRIR